MAKKQKEDKKDYCCVEDAKLERPALETLNQRQPFLLVNATKLTCWRENVCMVLCLSKQKWGERILLFIKADGLEKTHSCHFEIKG